MADRVVGIALGLIIGIAIVVAFVFFGGETIDAPSLEEERPAGQEREAPGAAQPSE